MAVSNDNGLALVIVTDAAGGYRYPALPPGRYQLAARLDGFDTARVADVALVLGAQVTIDLTLRPAGIAERVEVVAGSPRLAIMQATRATSLSSEVFERLPRGRDFTTIAAHAPGANDERKAVGIAIDGSTGAENRVMIDGIETTDTWIGTPGQYLATDFVEVVQVKSSGYSAERRLHWRCATKIERLIAIRDGAASGNLTTRLKDLRGSNRGVQRALRVCIYYNKPKKQSVSFERKRRKIGACHSLLM